MKNRNYSKVAIARILLISVVFLMHCSSKTTGPDSKKIIVGYLPIVAHLPAFIGTEESYFEDIEIDYKVFPTSNDLMAALETGRIDIATTIATAPFLALSNRVVSAGGDLPAYIFSYSKTTKSDPFDGIFTYKGSGIKSLSDLKGKVVGVFPGSTAKNIMAYVLERDYQITSDNIEWRMIPPNMQLDALGNHEIDALFAYETIRTFAEMSDQFEEIHRSIIATAQKDAPYGASAVNAKFYKENKSTAMMFINGFDRGIDFTRNSPTQAKMILKAKLGLPEVISENCNIEYRVKARTILADSSPQVLELFITMLQKSGELPAEISFSLDDILLSK